MSQFNSIDHYYSFDKVIKINEAESVLLKRFPDNFVEISHSDYINGTITKLGYYQEGKWFPYNPPNFNKLFILFRKYRNLKPALIRFLTPGNSVAEIHKVEKVFVCFKKRFHITIRRTKKNLNLKY